MTGAVVARSYPGLRSNRGREEVRRKVLSEKGGVLEVERTRLDWRIVKLLCSGDDARVVGQVVVRSCYHRSCQSSRGGRL